MAFSFKTRKLGCFLARPTGLLSRESVQCLGSYGGGPDRNKWSSVYRGKPAAGSEVTASHAGRPGLAGFR